MTLNEDKKTFTADTESGLDPTLETSIVAKLKRGRKITEEEKYKEDSRKKIIELRIELKNKNLNAEQRQKIRNKISAQESRLRKKLEFSELFKKHNNLLQSIEKFINILDHEIKSDAKENIT